MYRLFFYIYEYKHKIEFMIGIKRQSFKKIITSYIQNGTTIYVQPCG